MKKEKITNGMILAIAVNLVYTKGIGVTQGIIARQVGNDMWIATALSILQGIILVWVTISIIRRIPQYNIIEQTEVMLGSLIAKLVAIVIFLFFVGAYATVLITYVYHIKDYFSPDSSILLPVVVGLIVGIYGTYKGIEVVSRFAIMGLMSILLFNVLIILGSLKDFDIKEILPIFTNGLGKNIEASIHYNTDWAMVTMVAAILYPLVNDQKTWFKSGVTGIVFGGLTVLIWPILETGVLSPEVTGQYIVSCMQLARAAEIGDFIHRYEMIMVALFSISLYVQIMVILYTASLTVAPVFKLKDIRPLIIPIGIILSAFGYWIIFNNVRAMTFLTYYWPPIAMSIAVGLPVLIFILGFFFKEKLQQTKANLPQEEQNI